MLSESVVMPVVGQPDGPGVRGAFSIGWLDGLDVAVALHDLDLHAVDLRQRHELQVATPLGRLGDLAGVLLDGLFDEGSEVVSTLSYVDGGRTSDHPVVGRLVSDVAGTRHRQVTVRSGRRRAGRRQLVGERCVEAVPVRSDVLFLEPVLL